MARILSIDYGKKRTGLAVTDPLQIIAGGLATVPTHDLYQYLQDYVSHEHVERIVIGEPRQLNGEPSENMERVRQFVNRWKKNMPQVPIVYYDERFTSALAHKAMIVRRVTALDWCRLLGRDLIVECIHKECPFPIPSVIVNTPHG